MDNSDSSRPTVQGPTTQQSHVSSHHSAKKLAHEHKNKIVKVLVAFLLLIVIVWGGILLGEYVTINHTSNLTGMNTVNTSEYQSVFLTNGQVYFGKITTVNQYIVTVKDIYYLQVQQSVQPASNSTTNSSSGNNSVQLVKLGNELHGPQDEMTINRSQVLFWENLKTSGKVTQAILNYQK